VDKNLFNEGLLHFLRQSPTPFHAVQSMQGTLESAGFELLQEHDAWQLKTGSFLCGATQRLLDHCVLAWVRETLPARDSIWPVRIPTVLA
jgi:aspartyl aminopeptidase